MRPLRSFTIPLALLVVVFLPAGACAEDPTQRALLLGEVEDAPPDDISDLEDLFVEALIDGDEEKIRGMLSPSMLARTEKEMGASAIHKIITERFIPFFSDFKRLDPSVNSVKTKDADGHEGLAFFRMFVSTSGEEKPFVVYVLKEGGKLVIGNLVLNKTMSALGLNASKN